VLFTPTLDPNRIRPTLADRHPGRHLLLGKLPETLYEQLLAPASTLLVGKRLVYLVPHGPLHYVPFAALRTATGKHLLDLSTGSATGLALSQVPSATILLRNCLGSRPANGGETLALGFNDAGGAQPLRFAEAEAEHIAELLSGQVWTGSAPKRERLQRVGTTLRHLHIAGHALFTPRDPLGSWLLLGDNDQLSAREIIQDGKPRAELVTLSSCTSGISHVVPSDELLGLPRALLYAGASTIVCTRWEAIDIVALLVMDRFCHELQRHSPAIALRNAQVAVRSMRFAELAQLFATWHARGGALATAIGDPAKLIQDLALISRDASVEPNIESSGNHANEVKAPGDRQATGVPDPPDPQARPFASPLLWAPFMVIGRA
jgi:CHAT domain-containing protein